MWVIESLIHTITAHTHEDRHKPSTAIMLRTTSAPAERGKDTERKSEVCGGQKKTGYMNQVPLFVVSICTKGPKGIMAE